MNVESTPSMNAEREKNIDSLVASEWGISEAMLSDLDDYTIEFMALEMATTERSRANYRLRVKQLGIENENLVIDFGCGVGQWCLTLADANKHVIGVDKHVQRIAVADRIKTSLGVDNVEFVTDLDQLPQLAPGSVDAIVCYSVLMYVNGRDFIKRFHDLLRPGGKLYLMVDLPAWSLRSVRRNPSLFGIAGFGLMMLRTLLNMQRNIVYTKRSLRKLVTSAGFEIVSEGADGQTSFLPLSARPNVTAPDFLPNEFAGMQTLFELCAVKR